MEPQVILLAVDSAALAGGTITGLVLGGVAAWLFLAGLTKRNQAARQAEIDRIARESRDKADQIIRAAEVEAKQKLLSVQADFEKSTAETRAELKTAEKRIAKREDNLDKKLDVLDTKERNVENAERKLAQRDGQLKDKLSQVDDALARQRDELLRISGLSVDEAKKLCLTRIESEVEHEAGQMVERIISTAEDNADDKARQIVIQAIQRNAAEHTFEATVATVVVPSDDMKGRIIGREGRNIRAFEQATGVSVVVDDTPGVVIVSCFDPVRKEVARVALERLIKDGRIHPTRIEELVETAQKEVEQRVIEAGRKAVIEANVTGLNKQIVEKLGALHFRMSYGQNVLQHSIEVAYLCQAMADELGLDGALARRCGLLHDIGKAMDRELEGGHPKIGKDFCKRFNEPEPVLNAIEGHHGDVAALYAYTPLVTAADAISAARPGGRRESIERYIKRLQELEETARSFDGIRQVYAIQAGREVRVIVDAVKIDDRSSVKLARDIAKKIEETMTYPGEIKVTVLREIRAVEFAR